jgi:hypothetical protein
MEKLEARNLKRALNHKSQRANGSEADAPHIVVEIIIAEWERHKPRRRQARG